ncbi:Mitochondrial fission 1 protein A [Mucuna pruriens]|uniref:Mitochondrial fission 1 protein A n=1 Tax=Mucuna pruriens TaxID=157652 RepID=A0A371EU84_MUCPR|nr:Mitochondrial fission 1 protein A [Mucuna pruriens]
MAKLEAKLGMIVDSVGQFFSGKDYLPYCDSDVVAGCEREVLEAEKGSSDEYMQDCLLRLSWALVHSKHPQDVHRGIAMLEASLPATNDPLQQREKLYLLAVGYYRNADYSRSRDLVDRCLMIAPDWRQAVTLKKTIEDKITKDGVIGLGIAATAVGLIAGGIAAAVSRKKNFIPTGLNQIWEACTTIGISHCVPAFTWKSSFNDIDNESERPMFILAKQDTHLIGGVRKINMPKYPYDQSRPSPKMTLLESLLKLPIPQESTRTLEPEGAWQGVYRGFLPEVQLFCRRHGQCNVLRAHHRPTILQLKIKPHLHPTDYMALRNKKGRQRTTKVNEMAIAKMVKSKAKNVKQRCDCRDQLQNQKPEIKSNKCNAVLQWRKMQQRDVVKISN